MYILLFYFKESETSSTIVKKDKSLKDTGEDEDISIALEKEINQLRTECEMPLLSRKFQVYLCHYQLTLY